MSVTYYFGVLNMNPLNKESIMSLTSKERYYKYGKKSQQKNKARVNAYSNAYQKAHRTPESKKKAREVVLEFLEKNPLYTTWTAMKQRCHNSNHPNYHNYGGREITICQDWLDSYEQFEKDMGTKPTPEHSLDRIDNNGNYEPSNCKWSTKLEQANNRGRV